MTGGQRVEQRRIVAGVDGSQWSKAALAWAVRQAELTGAVVDAVTAWELPATSGLDPQLYLDYPAAAAKMLTEAIAEVGGRATVHPRVKPGHAAEVLVGASAGAELLVVGSRGHGGFTGMLLGSVSLHCLRHAHCPVVVVRGTRADTSEAPEPGPAVSRVWCLRSPLVKPQVPGVAGQAGDSPRGGLRAYGLAASRYLRAGRGRNPGGR